jgi:hypothetical protein
MHARLEMLGRSRLRAVLNGLFDNSTWRSLAGYAQAFSDNGDQWRKRHHLMTCTICHEKMASDWTHSLPGVSA